MDIDKFMKLNEAERREAIRRLSDTQLAELETRLSEIGYNKNAQVQQFEMQPEPKKESVYGKVIGEGILKTGELLTRGRKLIKSKATDIPRELWDLYVQLGAGMVDTLNDLGDLVGAPPQYEPAQPEPAETKLQEGTRYIGTFLTPQMPGLPPVSTALAMGTKAPAAAAKIQRVKNMLEPLAKTTGKSIAFIGELLSSIPREYYEKALKNPKKLNVPFKGPATFRAVGEKAQTAVNYITTEAAELVNKEADELIKKTDLFDASDYYNFMESIIDKQKGGGRVLDVSKKGQRLITEIENELLELALDPVMDGKARPIELHKVKKLIDQYVDFNEQTIRDLGEPGENILKQVRYRINQDLRAKYENYARVNDIAKEYIDLKKSVGPRLKDKTLARNIKSIAKSSEKWEMNKLRQIDEIVPDNLKFIDDLETAELNEVMSHLFPGQGGGSGSPQGAGNLLRFILMGYGTKGTTIPLASPMVHKQIIKRTPTIKKMGKTLIKHTKAPLKAVMDPLDYIIETREEN